jgi:hypothetical protein
MTIPQDPDSLPRDAIVVRAVMIVLITVAPIALCILLSTSPDDGTSFRPSKVAVSGYDAGSLEARLSRAFQDHESEETVRITDGELTSYLEERMRESCIQSPRVRFEDGRIRLGGTLTGGLITEIPLYLVLTVDGSRDRPCIVAQEGRLGELQAPSIALPIVDHILDGLLGQWGDRVSWYRLRVADGMVEITIR